MTAKPGEPFPSLALKTIDGRSIVPGRDRDGWDLLVVYRGHHCPRCRAYVAKLEEKKAEFEARNVRILLASADPIDLARKTVAEEGWTYPVAYGLSIAEMRELGVYITDPGGNDAIRGPYAEPGFFLINPDGVLHVLNISNAASFRPDIDVMLDGIIGTQDRNLPIRGLYRSD